MKTLIILVLLLVTCSMVIGCTGRTKAPETTIKPFNIVGQWTFYEDSNDTEYIAGSDSRLTENIIEFDPDGKFYFLEGSYIRDFNTGNIDIAGSDYSTGTYNFVPGTPGTIGEAGSYKLKGITVKTLSDNRIYSIDKKAEFKADFDSYGLDHIDVCNSWICRDYFPSNLTRIKDEVIQNTQGAL